MAGPIERSFLTKYALGIMAILVLLLVAGFLLGWCAAAHAEELPFPKLDGLTQYGYHVDICGKDLRAGGTRCLLPGLWYGFGWAKHGGEQDWDATLSVRPKRHQAVNDCEHWLDKLDKAVADMRKSKA